MTIARARSKLLSLLCALVVFMAGGPVGAAPGNGSDEVWWSFRPIAKLAPPQNGAAHPIDTFVLEKLKEKGLGFSPEADRRTLARRLYFDLTGLPPSPDEMRVFLEDSTARAYENLVDRLLASPQYGERWARHWLDVVHYGDTHGYDKDQPRPDAWPYRDYVIRAFNDDKPYARFVQEQIAGDVLFPNTADGIEALGFVSAGPWDLIGHAEVPETKTDGKIARHLDRDDMVANTIGTFNSLTVHCAQCHNHKFDPIPSEDYYSLQAVFAAVDRTTREYYREPELNEKRIGLKESERRLAKERAALEQEIAKAGGETLAALKKEIEAARKPGQNGSRAAEFGYHSAIEAKADAAKWVQADLGASHAITNIVLAPCWDDFAGIGAGFGFPADYRVEVSEEPEFKTPNLVREVRGADYKSIGAAPQAFAATATARYVRVTATRLAPRSGDFIFALAEMEVWNSAGANVARGAQVYALDSIENPVRWAKANLVDGIYPGRGQGTPTNLAELEANLAKFIEGSVPLEIREKWSAATNALARAQSELAAMPKPSRAFVGAVHHGSGAFRGTGPEGGAPRPVFVLARGDVKKPGKPAEPGALSVIAELPARFELPAGASEGERRKALALWLTDARHPLTWRTIVNRVWQYHFGRGLVDTPNDFGRMGGRPSHPELLDWLAAEFRDGGQSLKTLHRLIVTSQAYKQSSTGGSDAKRAAELDQDNRLLWRMNRRKIEAEALRDSVLAVSGKLQRQMFGPGFQDFVIEKPEHSPHYQYHLFDPDDAKSHRRSIYRFIVRSQQQPFMTTLDCADPSMMVDRRNESVSALQALALLNNGFMLAMAGHFAESVRAQETSVEGQVQRAFAAALTREPSSTELADLADFTRKHGLPNACRLLFNLNEFAFVD